jgi:hypothetical protein
MNINIKSRQLAKLYNDRIGWLMKYENFGRKCKFIYPPIKTECPNCLLNASQMSAGIYKPGGPEPFEETTCPVCLGKGIFEESVTEEDTLIVLFDHKSWFEPGNVAKLPDTSVMVIGDRLKSWNKVKKCNRVILNLDVYGETAPYRLYGEMYPTGLMNGNDKSGSRWFYAYLVRDGGG